MGLWDSSALVPLVLEQPGSARVVPFARKDPGLVLPGD